MKLKRTTADYWFSKCVRLRANYICQGCGNKYEENSRALHCSHFFSRAKKAVRYDGNNAFAHCFYCHQMFGSNPYYFVQHYVDMYGKDLLSILQEKSENMSLGKRAHKEKKEISKHYRCEANKLIQIRESGNSEWIDFVSWD